MACEHLCLLTASEGICLPVVSRRGRPAKVRLQPRGAAPRVPVAAHVRAAPFSTVTSRHTDLAARTPRRLTTGFVEAGGCVPEKFDAVEGTSNIDAEYGNQVRATPTDACLLSSMLMCMASYRAPTSTSSRAKALAGPSLSPSAFLCSSSLTLDARLQDQRVVPGRLVDHHSVPAPRARRPHSARLVLPPRPRPHVVSEGLAPVSSVHTSSLHHSHTVFALPP